MAANRHALPQETVLPPASLLLDTENPRLPSSVTSQVDAIRAMIRVQGTRLLGLAEHIVENGLNPAVLMIVTPADRHNTSFFVLDGNRRLATLKALEAPDLAEGVLPDAAFSKLKTLSKAYRNNPITQIKCVVASDRDSADVWIQLIHRGLNQGAGLFEWDGQVAARYDAKRGKKSEALQILDFVKDKPGLSEETRIRIADGKFPITNLTRLLGTPYVREKLGFDFADGRVVALYPESEILENLIKVIEDLGSSAITVSDIKRQKPRIDYINTRLSGSSLPDPKTKLPTPVNLDAIPAKPASATNSDAGTGGKANITVRRSRKELIPKDVRLPIPQHRIANIFKELKSLDVDVWPNAGAVMFRVFLELSVDYCLETKVKWPTQQVNNSKLAHKLSALVSYLVTNNYLNDAEADPARKAAGGQTLLATSVNTLHGYVHSRYFSPAGSELRNAWDDLEPFFVAMWRS